MAGETGRAEQQGEADRLPGLDEFLCFAVYSTNLAFNRVYKPLLDELRLTYPQYIALVALYETADQTVGQLGEKLFLDSSTLTPLLKRLEAMGAVTRQRDPRDERQVRINLTAQGRALRERGRAVRLSMQRATGLAPDEQRHLREEMVRLRANLTAAEYERRS
ncbi:DNA-binding transcriptional regulator, MarR family [Bosea sp. 62]|uniref:MarR family winged helix-turn-helix transcriptional regulator n=1 Tax=unclassified Bosea (in: a-proteobacteria) TaxID=2653178 RepID=UPI00125293F5|nr:MULTISPECIES: MarR family transcriptional regulator [unclassified Bosea (in: a-proteobacteria)]CAD5295443.1 DNA-binding transcriptional regulator, MarR family [Bosea sp. 21B]CAD5295806.1 DNA-binding transcriptional regulator, MarR family [Bosea sp. 46]CAD5298132.1 DNA-binding transcriptional regulator, MarR family [Bosea sp. 7B]VVT60999.1 DNA-binding transcriptional regulator, MarR family [Bosea sp. EC-HK365B]VXB33389.1 DNA-binding transcriptional regulator, MarR family [Bosea sp. 127]